MLRATRPPAQGCWTQSVPCRGHNTPFPLERSLPASFKRLLGRMGRERCSERGNHSPRARRDKGRFIAVPRRAYPL
jgi:hypothetical protein